MTIENWLMIAVIISTLIAPTLANLIQSRVSHPKQTPEASQPKNLIQRIGGWFIRLSNSPWRVPPFLILFNIYLLLSEFRRTTPVTRWTVYQISAAVAGIWYGLVLFLLNTAWESIRRQWEINREQQEVNAIARDVDLKLLDIIKSVSDTANATADKSLALTDRVLTELAKSREGRLNKLMAKIKGLLKG
jgi:hypothetical protein